MSKVIGVVGVLAASALGVWKCFDVRATISDTAHRPCESGQWSGQRFVPAHRIDSVFFVDVRGSDSETSQQPLGTTPAVPSQVQANPFLGDQ